MGMGDIISKDRAMITALIVILVCAGLYAAVYNIIEQLRDLLQQVYAQTENGYRVKTLTRIEIKESLDSFFTEE